MTYLLLVLTTLTTNAQTAHIYVTIARLLCSHLPYTIDCAIAFATPTRVSPWMKVKIIINACKLSSLMVDYYNYKIHGHRL